MYFYIIVLTFLVVVIYAYYIVFIVCLFPLSFYIKRKNKKEKLIAKNFASENKHKQKASRLHSNLGIWLNEYVRYAIYKTGHIPSHRIRDFLYRNVFHVTLDKGAVIYYGAEIRNPARLIIGKGTSIGDNVVLDARNGIVIGANVNFSSRVSIWTEQHDHRDPYFRCTQKKRSVVIGDRAWIGSNVTILPNVQIGEGAVCCAGSVVTKDVAPFDIVAGIPAKKIGERTRNLKYDMEHHAHFL